MQTSAYTTSPLSWTVPSATTPGQSYTVSAASPTGLLTCTCEASKYPKTRGRCWHIKAVVSGAIAPATVPAPAAAPVPAHDTTIVEGFDACGRPIFTPMCHACRRVGLCYLNRTEAETLARLHAATPAVRS